MASYYPPEMLIPSASVPADESDIEANAEVDQLDDDSEPDLGNDGGAVSGQGRGRALGQSLLPIVRLENIIQADGITGTLTMSKEALFIISVATFSATPRLFHFQEEFIKRLAQGGLDQAKSQERSAVQYEDMAATILQYQEFRFLEDYIPTPISLADALAEREVMEAKVFDEEPAAIPKPSNTVPSYAIMNNPSSTSKFRVSTNGTTPKTKSNGTRSNGQSAQPQASASSSSVFDARPWNHSAGVAPIPTYWMADQRIDSLKQYIAQRFPDIPVDTPTPELLDILTRRGVLPRPDAIPTLSGMSISTPQYMASLHPTPPVSVTPTTRNPSTDSLPPPPVPKEDVSEQMGDVQAASPSNGGVSSRGASVPPVVTAADAKMEET
ncbi:hypothetical protein CPB85DRAFT_1251871 [Mucidula mucida]|nr:hypothetical protein CPB85DRAFT_1251871 [Mucidula mucida]